MSDKATEARVRLEEILAPYGYYLEEKRQENQLRLAFTEVGLLAFAVLVWGVIEYAKGFISAKARSDADRLFRSEKPKEEELQRQFDEVMTELRHLKAQVNITEQLLLSKIKEDDVALMLQDLGFSRRAARRAAADVRPSLAHEVATLVGEGLS
jgi:alcohol dehydrogenase class IV